MPALGPRGDARKRARTAYQLRCAHRTWEDIAEHCGYGSPAAAHKAVTRHIARMPTEDHATARALSAGTHNMVIAELIAIGIQAKQSNKLVTAVEALDKASAIQDRHDKLIGLHVNVPQQIDITINESPAAAIRRARDELLASMTADKPAIEAQPILEAEIIE